MRSYSKVVVSGIITNIDLNSDIIGIVRPVAEITIYDKENEEWVDNVYIIFSDNASARQFKGLNVGAIVLVTGELVYYSGVGYAIYPEKYIILEKNKDKSPIYIQKVFFFDNSEIENLVVIKGNVVYVKDDIISLSHSIENNIRGDLIKQSVQPLRITNDIRTNAKKAMFVGTFTKQMIKGEAYELL